MRTIIGIAFAAIPYECAVIPPEKRCIVLDVTCNFLAGVYFENVRRVVYGERVVPAEHAAYGAVPWPFEAIHHSFSTLAHIAGGRKEN
jgi:Ni,Fe-hydrogenase III small subunit